MMSQKYSENWNFFGTPYTFEFFIFQRLKIDKWIKDKREISRVFSSYWTKLKCFVNIWGLWRWTLVLLEPGVLNFQCTELSKHQKLFRKFCHPVCQFLLSSAISGQSQLFFSSLIKWMNLWNLLDYYDYDTHLLTYWQPTFLRLEEENCHTFWICL